MSTKHRNKVKGPSHSKNIANKKAAQKIEEKKPKKQPKAPISGFSTLNQVAGVPKPREFHSSIPVAPTKSVKEPKCVCALCGQNINQIAQAMVNGDGEYVHFDCVLSQIKADNQVEENQVISYIGSGNFGICEKNPDGKYTIVRVIPYENPEKNKVLKEYVESLKV